MDRDGSKMRYLAIFLILTFWITVGFFLVFFPKKMQKMRLHAIDSGRTFKPTDRNWIESNGFVWYQILIGVMILSLCGYLLYILALDLLDTLEIR